MSALRARIDVVGSCNADWTVRVARLARPGETVLGGDLERRGGGKGANQAAAAARLGARARLLAAVGADDLGQWLTSDLEALDVDVSAIQRSPRPTGVALITLDELGENEIVVAPGANGDLDLAAVDLNSSDVLLASMEVPASVVDDAVRRARRAVLNVAPVREVDPETLSRCGVVIANEHEVIGLDVNALEHVIVTEGARGAVHLSRGRVVTRARPPMVESVDTVGAGDVFCAAYALRWARGESSDEALRYAVVAGALATLGEGARGALPTDGEVRQWLERV